jgi:hypothetical protein
MQGIPIARLKEGAQAAYQPSKKAIGFPSESSFAAFFLDKKSDKITS